MNARKRLTPGVYRRLPRQEGAPKSPLKKHCPTESRARHDDGATDRATDPRQDPLDIPRDKPPGHTARGQPAPRGKSASSRTTPAAAWLRTGGAERAKHSTEHAPRRLSAHARTIAATSPDARHARNPGRLDQSN